MNFLLTLCLSWVALAGSPVQLTTENFDHDTQIGGGMTTGAWFIKFYAPWCGHCKKMAPAWEELVDELADDPINVAEVDATVEKELASRFEIRGYPTLLYFKENQMYKYSGARQVEELAEFAREGYSKATPKAVPRPLGPAEKLRKAVKNLARRCSSPAQCLAWLSGRP
eukprot:Gregarina_sp_Pseudo_9__2203@NODE_2546_length_960_cov_259_027144_g2219_i1_p1_GENE_NODE_2546_length_960_cov_259_027144_g2219_i1NODE_2546_length_960_cov_259_027144_g2219_i1_p1_ORF_typecomplete_len169_score30_75Thioredoxin/PF00085_20/1_5e29Thioredoxin_2/PF13098_6/5_1e07Thioredoxin_3/PF13192_6/2_7e06TraF/PF13728_6/7_1e06AhpCTSA/PF00578_21/7_2e06Thioredoxin_8/PF13905_6/0_0027Thioredoxin_8/PF13905_6/11Thioredoxin_7/PF13899_6/3_1e05Calsequestrin/PF01216_17/0_0002HyaE/PF07449_11/0_00037OST3_OST6/PF04756_